MCTIVPPKPSTLSRGNIIRLYLLNKRSHGFFVLSNSWPVCQHILRELAEAGMCKFTQPKSCSCLLLSDNEQEHTSDITLPIRNVWPYSGRPTRLFTAFPIKGRKIGDRAGREQREMSSFLPGGGPRHQLRPCRRRGLGNAVHVAVAVEVHLVEEVSSVHSTLNGFM